MSPSFEGVGDVWGVACYVHFAFSVFLNRFFVSILELVVGGRVFQRVFENDGYRGFCCVVIHMYQFSLCH